MGVGAGECGGRGVKLYLVLSPAGGGSAGDLETLKLYLAESDIHYLRWPSEGVEKNMKVYLAEHDIRHHAMASHGVQIYLADTASSVNHRLADDGLKLYLADANQQRHVEPQHGVIDIAPALRLRILLSYWYYKDTDLDVMFAKHFTPPYPEVFADSGAFSAMTQGAAINLDDYAKWLRKYKHLFSVYASLDVIKNAEATWKNQLRLEQEHGLYPLPVFHVLEDWSYLDRYIERYPYIALGVAGTRSDVYMPWLIQCFKRAKDKAVYHGFGITTWQVLKSFPWYSVDSSSWGQGFRYGGVPVFDIQRGRFFKVQLGNHVSCYKYASLLRSLGFDPADFSDRARNDRKKICALAALSYIIAEQWLQKRWGLIHIPERVEQPGVKMYLAEVQQDLSDVRNVVPYIEKAV